MPELLSSYHRSLSPPVMIVKCPGDGGHYWSRLNLKWCSDVRVNISNEGWCPDHEAEKRKLVQKSLSEAAKQRALAYGDLPLPQSKRCANPNPTAHAPGAILPSGKFYRRPARGVNRERGLKTLDSRCKACRVEETRVRREGWDEERRAQDRKRRAELTNERRRKGRRALAAETDRKLPAAPLRTLLHEVKDEFQGLTRIADSSGVDEAVLRRVLNGTAKQIQRSTVDLVLVGIGRPNLFETLWPYDEYEGARKPAKRRSKKPEPHENPNQDSEHQHQDCV